MREQSITISSLKKNIYKSDIFKYDYLKDKIYTEHAIIESDYISNKTENYKYYISEIFSKSEKDPEKRRFSLQIFPEKLLVRKCAKNISKCVEVKNNDRNKAVRELISCLKWAGNLKIIRYDIKRFYETLKQETIFQAINENNDLSSHTKEIVKNFLNQFWSEGGSGLPRGIEISNPIANLILQKLDNEIKKLDDCVFYARFVDDIIAISNNTQSREIINKIKNLIPSELEINSAKSYTATTSNTIDIEISFLGYKIKIPKIHPREHYKYREIEVSHSDNKIKDLKRKIFISMCSYRKDQDFSLLFDRLKFISTNRSVKKGKGTYKSGIYYSSNLVNNYEPLKEVDKYLYAIIKNKGIAFFTGKLNLSSAQVKKLKEINFVAGFRKKYHYNPCYFRKMEIIKKWR